MFTLHSFDEIKENEKFVIETLNYQSLILMENAANSSCNFILNLLDGKIDDLKPLWMQDIIKTKLEKALKCFEIDSAFTFLIGSSNNGADGIAIARKLALRLPDKVKIKLLLISDAKTVERKYQEDLIKNLNLENVTLYVFEDKFKDKIIEVFESPFIIDCITGIGLKAPLSKSFIERLTTIESNIKKDSFIISVDLPSGMCLTSEKILSSDVTLMLGELKSEFFFSELRKYSKTYVRLDIDLPFEDQQKISQKQDRHFYLLEMNDVFEILNKREFFTNKGNFGKTYVFANSLGTLGASILAALAAFKTGIGYIYIVLPEEYQLDLKARYPNIITIGYNIKKLEDLYKTLLDSFKGKNEKISALIGSGFGLNNSLFFGILEFLFKNKIKTVIDGDGLSLIANNFEKFQSINRLYTAPFILTPHIAEFSRIYDSFLKNHDLECCSGLINSKDNLGNKYIEKRDNDRVIDVEHSKNMLEKCNEKCNIDKCISIVENIPDCSILLKDYISAFICNEVVYINEGCFDGYAKAGTGDFIAGLLAGFLANYSIKKSGALTLILQDQLAFFIKNRRISSYSIKSEDLIQLLDEVFSRFEY
jgi:hydroxyethylthiazole kinase-like uncharacterized protein yjeF